jgi:hypothetical protein
VMCFFSSNVFFLGFIVITLSRFSDINIYSARVLSLARSKVLIKFILFFKVQIIIEFESRHYHYIS